MKCQAVTIVNDGGIINDANLWSTETMGNGKYPFEPIQRVMIVSLETK